VSPKEAVVILDNVSGLAPVNRVTHVQVQSAVEVLLKYIEDHEPKTGETPTPPKRRPGKKQDAEEQGEA